MNRDAGEILKEALALPAEARAALADHLWDSLDPEMDSDVEESWRHEIRLRLAQLDSGAVAAVPWAEARSNLAVNGGALDLGINLSADEK